MRFIYDTETNGLLVALTKIHCLVLRDIDTNVVHRFSTRAGNMEVGLRLLQQADLAVGHNCISFDDPAIKKVYPWFHLDESKVLDTLVMARLMYPDMVDIDLKLIKAKKLPGNLFKRHSLEAWGHRLGFKKGDYAKEMKAKGLDPWAEWNIDMEDYCVGDTEVTLKLFQKLTTPRISPYISKKHKPLAVPQLYAQQAIDLEHRVQWIIARQERHGFKFDKQAAAKLYSSIVAKKLEVEQKLKHVFKPRYLPKDKVFIPKADNKQFGYVAGAHFQKLELTEFNPGSRDHINTWFTAMYDWQPDEFTPDGKPKVDEDVLKSLPYPEAKLLNTYLMLTKRLGQLAEGKEAWLRHEKDGWMHGSMNPMGTITGRASHAKPNMGQVPKVQKNRSGEILYGLEGGYGYECRQLFCVPEGKELVGIDQSGIELRNLAHYMARYDGGAYVKELLLGDIHTVNQKAAGLPTRDNAKTFIYAFLYGAGAEKIGKIIGKGAADGQRLKVRFLAGLPALKKLIDDVQKAADRGYLVGLDGRHVPIRSKHAALNTLLQSCGAILAKQWLVFFDEEMRRAELATRVQQVAWVHDEIQAECDTGLGETVGKKAVEAIEKVGVHFNFRCPITGEYGVGRNWAETH